jgi:hypothetical protein
LIPRCRQVYVEDLDRRTRLPQDGRPHAHGASVPSEKAAA